MKKIVVPMKGVFLNKNLDYDVLLSYLRDYYSDEEFWLFVMWCSI